MLATVGEQSDKPIVSTFLGSEGMPELLRVPDLEGAAGRGSVPSYPAPESAVRALARVVNYSHWVNRPPGTVPWFEDFDTGGRAAAGDEAAAGDARRRRRCTTTGSRELLALLRDHARAADRRSRRSRRRSPPGSGYGWNVVLKATADRLRQRPDLAHVWRNIDDEIDMNSAWENLTEHHRRSRQAPSFVVQHDGARRVSRSRSAASRTRCSGRSCPSGWPVRRRSCSATSPTGSRR